MALRLRTPLSLVCLAAFGLGCSPAGKVTHCTGTEVELRHNKVLTVGVDLSYPPFAFNDARTGDPTGFEVELLDDVASKMGLRILYVNRTSAALIPGALAHRHDIAASALRDTDELLGQACRSTPYLPADLGILVRAPNPLRIKGAADLPGRTVGVLRGSEGRAWATKDLGRSRSLVEYGAPEDMLADLHAGRIDAAIDELPVALHAQAVTPELRVVHTIALHSSYVFATAPDNGGLMRLVDSALADLRKDGTLAELQRRWFGRRL